MIKLGNILHSEPLLNHKQLDYINYGSTQSWFMNDLPTLRVGWRDLKSTSFAVVTNILNKQLDNNYWWEFSPSEEIIQYSMGLDKFVKSLPRLFIEQYMYVNVDPFNFNLFTINDLEKYYSGGGDLYVYKNDMIYYRLGKVIYGLKLSAYSYIGVDVVKIIEMLKEKAERSVIDDSTQYQKYYRLFPEFPLLKRSMVVFLFE
jgi:hypothetical protein